MWSLAYFNYVEPEVKVIADPEQLKQSGATTL